MKKRIVLYLFVIFASIILISCKSQHEDIDEIVTIVDAEILEINKDDKYEENIDLIIEKVFNENGIIDLDKINTAKSKITISIPK